MVQVADAGEWKAVQSEMEQVADAGEWRAAAAAVCWLCSTECPHLTTASAEQRRHPNHTPVAQCTIRYKMLV